MNDCLVEVKEFAQVFTKVEIEDEDFHLLAPLIKEITDAASSVKNDKVMDSLHRLQQLEATLSEATSRLQAPDLVESLRTAASARAFWATVDLQALVRRRVGEQSSLAD